jgi:hypothetical protein
MHPKVEEYINKQPSPQKEICMKLRELILNTTGSKEEWKWGAPVYSNSAIYIGAFKKNVNLGFKIEGLSEDDISQLEGTGKTMRHIKIHSLEEMDEEKILRFIKLVSR